MTWVYVPSTSALAAASDQQPSRPAGSPPPSATSSASHSASTCCKSACAVETLPPHQSGTTCAPSTGDPGVDAWISSSAVSPASPTLSPASSEGTPTSAIFGRIFGGSFARFSPGSSSLRTYQGSLFTEEGCSEFSESLPPTGLMRSGRLYRLRTLAPTTSASGSGLWPTPVQDGDRATNYAQGGRSLGATARSWPTPSLCGNYNRKGASATSGDGLDTAVRNWPTPRAEDSEQTGGHRGTPDTLTSAARLWPSPTASDYIQRDSTERSHDRKNPRKALSHHNLGTAARLWPTPKNSFSGPDFARAGRDGSGGDDLATAAAREMLPTPRESDWRSGKASDATHQKNSRQLCEVVTRKERGQGGSLNPTWVSWLMGWPLRWLECAAPTGGRKSRTCRDSQPELSSESQSSSASGTAGCLTWRLTLRDAFARGYWQRRAR